MAVLRLAKRRDRHPATRYLVAMRFAVLLVLAFVSACRVSTDCEKGDPSCSMGALLLSAQRSYRMKAFYVCRTTNLDTYLVNADIVTPAQSQAIGASTSWIRTDLDGKYLYIQSSGNNVDWYSIDRDTGLIARVGTFAIALAGNYEPSPYYKNIMVASLGASKMRTFSIGSDGSLTTLFINQDPGSTSPGKFVFHPTLPVVYTLETSTVRIQDLAANGALTFRTTAAATATTTNIAIDPNGRYLAVANNAAPGIQLYTIDSTGGLSAPSSAAFTNISILAFDSTGSFLMAGNTALPGVTTVNIPAMQSVQTFNTGTLPTSVIADRGGKYVLVGNPAPTLFSLYQFTQTGGLPSVKYEFVPTGNVTGVGMYSPYGF